MTCYRKKSTMLINYIKIAIRNIRKHKLTTAVNVLGLGIGVAVCLLLLNFIQFQQTYDTEQRNADRIFRVPMEIVEKGGDLQTFAFTYPAVAPHLKKDFPEIEQTVRLRFNGGLARNGDIAQQVRVCFTESSFFDVFSFPMLEGDAKNVLTQPYSAVLTEKMAGILFPGVNPVGKSFRYNDREWTVRGLLKNLPVSSHLYMSVGILMDYPTYVQISKERGADAEGSWGWSDFYTYVLLRDASQAPALAAKMPDFAQRYMGEDMQKEGFEVRFNLQPLRDIHLRSSYNYELAGNGNFKFIYLLGAAGILILLIAWMNYINLATARAFERAKEVGIRKVNGAMTRQLMQQFLVEALVVNFLSIVLGAGLFFASLGAFARLVDRDPMELLPMNPLFWASLAGLFGLGALLTGAYPARQMTRFNAMLTMKGKLFEGKAGTQNWLRKTLVVSQFSVSMLLLTGALALIWQLRFMQKAELGVQIDQTLVVRETVSRDSSQQHRVRSFLNDVEALSGVVSTARSTSVPGEEIGSSTDYKRLDNSFVKRCRVLGADERFVPQFGLQLLAGRNFSENFLADRETCVLNEAAVNVLGYPNPEAALGHQIKGGSETSKPRTIIGVLRDYHQQSLRDAYDPTVFVPEQEDWEYYSVKVNTSDAAGINDRVQALWKTHFPETPVTTFFLDDYYNQQYRLDQAFGSVLAGCTALALLVACLGLFGLSVFTVSKKQKEIGIRKVLGASAAQVVLLVTREYVQLILLAGVLMLPLAVFGVQKFLSSYAFQVHLGWWFYLIPFVLLLLVAFGTTLAQSLRAAFADPVKSLRTE